MKPLSLTLALILCFAAPAAAQHRAASLATVPPARLAPAPVARDTTPVEPAVSSTERLAARGLAGSLGFTLGVIGGVYLGAGLGGDCACDDPGLAEALYGGAIGGVVGGAVAAALPDYHRGCGFAERAARGVLGSLVGGVLGGALTAGAEGGAGIFLVPIGGGIGAGIAADC